MPRPLTATLTLLAIAFVAPLQAQPAQATKPAQRKPTATPTVTPSKKDLSVAERSASDLAALAERLAAVIKSTYERELGAYFQGLTLETSGVYLLPVFLYSGNFEDYTAAIDGFVASIPKRPFDGSAIRADFRRSRPGGAGQMATGPFESFGTAISAGVIRSHSLEILLNTSPGRMAAMHGAVSFGTQAIVNGHTVSFIAAWMNLGSGAPYFVEGSRIRWDNELLEFKGGTWMAAAK